MLPGTWAYVCAGAFGRAIIVSLYVFISYYGFSENLFDLNQNLWGCYHAMNQNLFDLFSEKCKIQQKHSTIQVHLIK